MLGPEAIEAAAKAEATTTKAWSATAITIAGAGPDERSNATGLVAFFAPVIPRRLGLSGADAASTARGDVITITYVPPSHAQTTTGGIVAGGGVVPVNSAANCPHGQAACGFQAGMTAVATTLRLRRASRGDAAAFAVVYERHHQALYRYCRSILRHE